MWAKFKFNFAPRFFLRNTRSTTVGAVVSLGTGALLIRRRMLHSDINNNQALDQEKHAPQRSSSTKGKAKFSFQIAAIPKSATSANQMVLMEGDSNGGVTLSRNDENDPDNLDRYSYGEGKWMSDARLAGEDAFCVVSGRFPRESLFDDSLAERGEEVVWMAVADGVGGWTKQGIDPSKFSGSLVHNLRDAIVGFVKRVGGESVHVSPRRLLHEAYQGLLRHYNSNRMGNSLKDEAPLGSSTACLVRLSSADGLCAANLGDSGFLVLRPHRDNKNKETDDETPKENDPHENYNGGILLASRPQQSRFNCPVQLKLTPQGSHHDITGSQSEFYELGMSSKPSYFSRHKIYQDNLLQPGDVVIVASDGLWDNLHTDEIVDIGNATQDRSSLAAELALAAYETSVDGAKRDTPFAIEYNKAHPHAETLRSGGKVDDITVLVAIVHY